MRTTAIAIPAFAPVDNPLCFFGGAKIAAEEELAGLLTDVLVLESLLVGLLLVVGIDKLLAEPEVGFDKLLVELDVGFDAMLAELDVGVEDVLDEITATLDVLAIVDSRELEELLVSVEFDEQPAELGKSVTPALAQS